MKHGMIGAAVAAAALASLPAQAVVFSAAYVFGDSLSDNGNAADAISNNAPGYTLPNPPYFNNSFTNGKVAVQVMAERFGLQENAALFPPVRNPQTGAVAIDPATGAPVNPNFYTGTGTNYAFAGATATTAPGVGQFGANLPEQLAFYFSKSVVDPNALYTVFIGGNDVRRGAEAGNPGLVGTGVTAELVALQQLLNAGAKHLLVVNVPDIGAIPEYALSKTDSKDETVATAFTNIYNRSLELGLGGLTKSADVKLYAFDLFTYDQNLRNNPGSLGITNVTDPCYVSYPTTSPKAVVTSAACGGGTSVASNIDSFYYWDDHHPTAKVQAALGNALYDFVGASEAPEPASWAMMLTGFALTGAALRRRRAVAAVA